MNTTDEAVKILTALKPSILKMIRDETASCVRRKKVTVTAAAHTNSAGNSVLTVREAFGDAFDVPYVSALSSASVGDVLWCEYAYSANNMIAVANGDYQ